MKSEKSNFKREIQPERCLRSDKFYHTSRKIAADFNCTSGLYLTRNIRHREFLLLQSV